MSPCQVASATMWPCLSPHKVPAPHQESLPKSVPTALCHSQFSLCVTRSHMRLGSPQCQPTPCLCPIIPPSWGN